MPKRIQIDDLKLFPIQAFLNAIHAAEFVSAVDGLLSGVGRGYDGEVACTFPNELDADEAPFDGVECSVGKESVVVPKEVFFDYLRTACDAHVLEHPEGCDPQLKRGAVPVPEQVVWSLI